MVVVVAKRIRKGRMGEIILCSGGCGWSNPIRERFHWWCIIRPCGFLLTGGYYIAHGSSDLELDKVKEHPTELQLQCIGNTKRTNIDTRSEYIFSKVESVSMYIR